MIVPEVVGSQHISPLPMVCRYPELDGANVPHGLGVVGALTWRAMGFFNGQKTRSQKKLASPKFLPGNT